jgi:adenosylcobinamide-GDP ribazoletransferase
MIREHIQLFFTALMFLTRLPCALRGEHTPESLAKSSMYFPLVGLLVGGIGALVYRLVACGYSTTTAVLSGLAATAVVTGAFHEDAFADMCDGFGGWTPARRLEIMRDSRVGSFGVVGLVLLIGIKVTLLGSMPLSRALLAFLTAHTYARWSTILMIAHYPYVTDAASLAKPFAASVTRGRFAFATLVTALAGLLCGPMTALAMFLVTSLLCLGAGRFFGRWLGGLSGDCLGAVNQVVEALCYAVIVQSPLLEAGVNHLVRR